MAKIRIKGLPTAKYGGQLPGTGSRNSVPNQQLDSRWNFATGTAFNQQDPYKVSNTLQPVDRDLADIEAEKGETVIGDFDGDGMQEHMDIGGKRHSEGGTPLNVPDQAFIYSDTKALKIKDPAILARFGASSSATPAKLAKKYDLNAQKAILDNPDTDPVTRKTAQMMYDNYSNKLGQLAQVQEGMKGLMEQRKMMKFGGPTMQYAPGGYYPINAHRGAKGTTWSDQQLQYGAEDIGYPNDPNGQGFGQWLNSTHPELVNYVNGKLGKPNTYTPDNPIGSEWGLRHQYAIERGMDQQLDYMPNRPMNVVPPTIQGPDPNNMQSENIPYLNLGTIPAGDGKAVDPNTHKAKFPQLNGIDANTLGDLAFGLKALTTRKYGPWEAPVNAVIPGVTFESDQPYRNAISEQANAIADRLAMSGNSKAGRAALQALQGQVGAQAAQVTGEVGNRNVQLSNQGNQNAAQIMNQEMQMDRDRRNRLYQGNVTANQQYKNSLDNLSNELVARTAARQDERYKNAWMDKTSPFFTHDRNGMPVFKSAQAEAAFNKMQQKTLNGNPSGGSSVAGTWKAAYDNAVGQGIPEDAAKDIADKLSGIEAKTRRKFDAEGNSKGYTTTQRFGGPVMQMGGVPQYSIGGEFLPPTPTLDMQQYQQPQRAQQSSQPITGKLTPVMAGKFFVSQGIAPHVAAGIVGNISQESGFNSAAVNPTSGAFGLGQWLGKRKERLFKMAKEQGVDPTDPQLQLSYLINEPGESSKAIQAAMMASTPQEASVIWANKYERMGKAEANYNKRMKSAASVYSYLNQPLAYGGPVKKVRIKGIPE